MGYPIDPHRLVDYSDNEEALVADRLREELVRDSSDLAIATGYMDPGVWDLVGEELALLKRFRLLLGKDFELVHRANRHGVEQDIARAIAEALADDLQALGLPTPTEAKAVQGWLDFLARPDAEVDVRVWPQEFLHAKAYLFPNSAGVGSANFTVAGLSRNRELVVWRQDRTVVAQLEAWFERHWEVSDPYKKELRAILATSRFGTQIWTPYQVLIRTLAERYGIEQPESLDGAQFTLKWFQEDAVFRLIRLLNGPARGALLADAVGLGKTFMALGVIHHVLYQTRGERRGRGRPVTLIIPASMKPTWDRELERAGMDWACHVLTLQSLKQDWDSRPFNQSDLVVIDEAHRLRGGGVWFQKAMELITEGAPHKQVLLLSATPVHTSMRDLTNLLRLITKNQRNVWAPEIPDFEQYLRQVERQEGEAFPLLDRSIVRRSRSDLQRAAAERRAAGLSDATIHLPRRRLAHVAYTYATDPDADDLFDQFAATLDSLELAPYRFRAGASATDGEGLAGLFVAGLLKRFESSLRAIRISLDRLDQVLAHFAAALQSTPPRMLNLRDPLFRRLTEAEQEGDRDDGELEATWADWFTTLTPVAVADQGRIPAVLAAITRDRARIAQLRTALPAESHDGKLAALGRLLTDPAGLGAQRVLVFSQFRDTACYIAEYLCRTVPDGESTVAEIDGGTLPARRGDLTRWFDPDQRPVGDGPRVLVSTDVLAEGHNLQLAQAVVNFDLHWNPQVVVQRAGRVDRLNSPHPAISIQSFLPAEGLDAHLGLVRRLNARFALIHHLGLGDEATTKLDADQPAFTFEQVRRLYHDEEAALDEVEKALLLGSSDYMRQPLEAFLRTASLTELQKIPVGVQARKFLPDGWRLGPGTFIAFRLGPAGEGETHWRFYPANGGPPQGEEAEIFRAISAPVGEAPAPAPEGDTTEGPTALIDWELLRRAATELTDAINRRRTAIAVTRGASERSRQLRVQLLALLQAVPGEPPTEAQALLDRLEEVRVEDYDHRPGYRTWREAFVQARKAPGDLASFQRVLELGLALLGSPVGVPVEPPDITPEQLTLVAWEVLVERAPRPEQVRWL